MKICELPALPNDATTCQSNWDQNSYYEWIKESTGMILPYNTMEEVESHFRNSALYYEKVRICTTADSNEDDAQCSEVAFDKTANIVTGSLMNMIKTTLVMIILIWANLSFGKGERAPKRQHPQLILYLTHNTKQTNQFISADAQNLVLTPIEKMIALITMLSTNPMASTSKKKKQVSE